MEKETPNKIYLYPSRLNKGKILSRWFMTRYNQDSVEYIRKDAFIERACDYLMEYEFNDSPTIADRRKRVDEFVNYMKGE